MFGDNLTGNSGLTRWSSQGELEWENPFCDICDCYAMNLDKQNNLWFYYYTKFDLVKTDYEKHWIFSPGINGSYGFLLGQDGVSILFQDGYRDWKFYQTHLRGVSMTRAKECMLVAPDGRELLQLSRVVFHKSILLVLDDDGTLYGTNWIG